MTFTRITVMFLFFIAWELLVDTLQIPRYLLPAPSVIALRFFSELQTPQLWHHLQATSSVAFTGVIVAYVLGSLIGWLFYQFPHIKAGLNWFLSASQSIPILAIAPLILIWINDSFWARAVVAIVITFFPVFSATYTGLQLIQLDLREVAVLYGASRIQRLWYVELPLTLPVMFSGLRTSVVLATTGAVVGEYLGGRDGLGALINIARGLFDTPLVFVAIACLIIITLGLTAILNSLETRVLRSIM
ncbi:MAG: ABC transporter permease [Chloroflexales bacterium]|nr:ABC transporter permease [Chloroflexales bacterium]